MDYAFKRLTACVLVACLSGCGGDGDGDKGSNGVPRAGVLTLTVNEDTPGSGAFDGYDPDGDRLTASIVTPPSKGTVTVSATDPLRFTYTPSANENGTDTFAYTVSDGRATSAAASATITINALNDAPVITGTLTTSEDQAVTVTLVTDAEGLAAEQISVTTNPAHGTVAAVAGSPGRFTYTPAPDFYGSDSMVVGVSDSGTNVQQTVAITVTSANDAPVANRDEFYTPQNTAARFDVMANDAEVDSDSVTVTITTPPASGSATVNTDGTIQYTPAAAFAGFTSLTYRVTDASGLSASATVKIGVGQHWGVVFQESPNDSTPKQLYYADGTQRFQVNAALTPTQRLVRVVAAKTAPIVFYSTKDPAINRLYRVDLSNPGTAVEIDNPTTEPGITGFAINDDGTKVVYSFGTQVKVADVGGAVTTQQVDSGAATSFFMNPSGTKAFYAKGNPAAFYTVNTSGAPAPVQITSTAPVNKVLTVLSLSDDERRLVYSVIDHPTYIYRQVDPTVAMSDSLLIDGTALDLRVSGSAAGGSVFYGRSATLANATATIDVYSFDARHPGALTKRTVPAFGGQITTMFMTEDAKRFYYTRSSSPSMVGNSTLYGVNVSNPSVAETVAESRSPTWYGIEFFAMGRSGRNVVYSANHNDINAGVEYSKLFFRDLSTPNAAPVQLQQFGFHSRPLIYAPDESVAVTLAAEARELYDWDLYLVTFAPLAPVKVSVGRAGPDPVLALRP